jgi:hypothetical protein
MYPNLADFEAHHREARSAAFSGRAGSWEQFQYSDLLPSRARTQVAAAIGDWKQAGRGAEAEGNWRSLVNKSVAYPTTLGFVGLPNGTTTLAVMLHIRTGSASRCMTRWEARGLIRTYRQVRDRGRPSIVGVEIPAVTETLIWIAERSYDRLVAPSEVMPTHLALQVAVGWLKAGERWPNTQVRTYADAQVALQDLRARGVP